jgi:hypothetical protein
MKSTPIQSMEEITNIPPLCKRRECKAMIQATKYQCSQNHPMNTRLRTTFLGQTQEIELRIRDKSLTKKIPGSFTKVCQTHSFHPE